MTDEKKKGKTKTGADLATRPEGDELAKPEESTGDWSFVVAHFILLGVLVGVLYGYRTADAKTLGVALGAVVVALVAVRFDRIKKLTSKFVSYETRDVVKKADAATTRANKAAQEAKQTAADAAAAAADAKNAADAAIGGVMRADATLIQLREMSAELAVIAARSFAGRGSPSEERRLAVAQDLDARLRELGCSDEQVARATGYLLRSIRLDLTNNVLTLAYYNPAVRAKVGGQRMVRDLREQCKKKRHRASPDELKDLLDKIGLDDELSRERRALERYRVYMETGQLVAPDVE
jgi:hypothetical protein